MDRPKTVTNLAKSKNLKTNTSDIRFVYKRPLSATISNLAIQENKRQQSKKPLLQSDHLLQSLDILKKSKIQNFSMQETEISKMLVRLDRITRNTMCGQKKVELCEAESISVELFAGESQYAFVNTRGQTCPLNVIIKRNFGSVEVYTSRKIKEPTKLLNDEVFTKDLIKLEDKSFFFITPFIAFNFTATKDSNFSVSIVFGQKATVKHSRKNVSSAQSLPKVGKNYMEEEIVKKKLPEKNFVKMNQTFAPSRSRNFKSAEVKRHEVKERYRNLMLEAHEKKLSYIKKNEIRLDAELKGMEIIEVIRRKENFEKFWLTLAMLGSSLLEIKKLVRIQRQVKLVRIHKSIATRKIQRKFRDSASKNPLRENLLLMTLLSMKNFQRTVKFQKPYIKRSIVDCILKSRRNNQVPLIFLNFFNKIVSMQKTFREYQIVRDIRLEELSETWANTVNKRLHKINAYKKKPKKWKKKQIEKYSVIDENIKKKILADYLVNTMKKYLESVKEFKSRAIEKMTIAQKVKFLQSEIDSVTILCPPVFYYIPSYKEMLSMVDMIVGGDDDS